MFTYTCPTCRTPSNSENIQNGAVLKCVKCHKQMRVIHAEEPANSGAANKRLLERNWGPLLVGAGALAGIIIGGVILLSSFLLEGKPTQNVQTRVEFAQQNVQAGPKADASPKTEAKLKGDTGPKADADPMADARPKADASVMTSDELYNEMLKSCVWILATDGRNTWSGSGSLIDRDEGLVLTNEHVANRRCKKIWVTFPIFRDGKLVTERESYEASIKDTKNAATLVNERAICDLALIRLSRLPKGVKALRLTKRKIRPGQALHTVGGNPQGNTGMWIYSPGAVRQISSKRWSYGDGLTRDAEIIASSVSINAGDSGGAVVDNRGYLVGVNALSSAGVLNTGHIHVNEVRMFLQTAYQRMGKQFIEPPDDGGGTISADKIAALMRGLQALESASRKQAAIDLGKIGSDAQKAAVPLLKIVQNPTEVDAVRRAAVFALAEIGKPDVEHLKLLLSALEDKNSKDARRYAALSLGSFPEDKRKEAIEGLKNALKDDDAKVRQNAALALATYGKVAQEEANAELVECLRDNDLGVREAVHEALKAGGVPDDVDLAVVKELLSGEKDGKKPTIQARYWGVYLLVRKFKEKGLPHIIEALEKEENFGDPVFVIYVVKQLAEYKLNSLEVGTILSKALDHREESVWMVAIDTFWALKGSTFGDFVKPEENTVEASIKICVKLPKVLAMLEKKTEKEGLKAEFTKKIKMICTTFNKVDGLGFKSSTRLVEILSKGVDETDDLARRVAVNCLERIGKDKETAKAALALRTALLKEKSAEIRVEILAALAALGKAGGNELGNDKEIQEELNKWINDARDDNHEVRVMASLAMASLYPDQPQSNKAYRVLARALLLTNADITIDVVQLTRAGLRPMPVVRSKPNEREKELHERAKQALSLGGIMAAEAICTVFESSFLPARTDKVDLICDKLHARITAFQVLAKIGSPLMTWQKVVKGIPSNPVRSLITRELNLQKLNLEDSRVISVAREAQVEIFGK